MNKKIIFDYEAVKPTMKYNYTQENYRDELREVLTKSIAKEMEILPKEPLVVCILIQDKNTKRNWVQIMVRNETEEIVSAICTLMDKCYCEAPSIIYLSRDDKPLSTHLLTLTIPVYVVDKADIFFQEYNHKKLLYYKDELTLNKKPNIW